MGGLPGIKGKLRMRLRTRWVDEGHEAPTPRELWIEAVGSADSLDQVTAAASAAARLLSTIMAFAANATVGHPEVHLAYDATSGRTEREFLEVFVPDERGLPTEGYAVTPAECNLVYESLDRLANDGERPSRALYQYELALRHWYFGGGWLALAHLYMAVEVLTVPMIRKECQERGICEADLARIHNIDPDDPKRPRWRPALESWARLNLIFKGDKSTYKEARSASDGLEHGFLDLNDINKKAMAATEATFEYVRQSICYLLGITSDEHSKLVERQPHDVQSLRKMIRGHFIGEADDPAAPGEEYPTLVWTSSVRTLSRDGDAFNVSFDEKFSVRCAPGLSFRGTGIEIRGRRHPGEQSLKPAIVEVRSGTPKLDLSLMSSVNKFATSVANTQGEGMSHAKTLFFGRFSELISIFEAIHALLVVNRAVEAITLLNGLMTGTCVLQAAATDLEKCDGIMIRLKLDSLARQIKVMSGDAEAVQRLNDTILNIETQVANAELYIPSEAPDVRASEFYREHKQDFLFVEEVARADEFAIAMHMEKDSDGNIALRTQIMTPELAKQVVAMSAKCLIESSVAMAKVLGKSHNEAAEQDLRAAADVLAGGER